jgi:hypothetical protein
VKQALETFCGVLPGNASQECNKFVEDYFALAWVLLQQEIVSDAFAVNVMLFPPSLPPSLPQDTGEACTLLKLCNGSSRFLLVKSPPPPPLGAPIKCTVCELVTTFLQPYVDSSETEVGGLCRHFAVTKL